MARPAPKQTQAPSHAVIVTPEEARRLQQLPGNENLRVVNDEWFEWQRRVLSGFGLPYPIEEIGLFGGKGSGKSSLMRAFLVMGNPHEKATDANGNLLLNVHRSYTYHPSYRGLILRKNAEDLDDFIGRANLLYKNLGGIYANGMFTFPSGAVVDCGHMKDKTAYQKYIGIEYQRIAIDEAGLIADYESYNELWSCMRSPFPELHCQMILASNCGGPGVGWIMDRFMTVRDKNGNAVPHGTVIQEKFRHPFTGEEKKRSRIWVFSTIADNPIYRTSDYAITLISNPDKKQRAAYFEGKWDALWGTYFGDVFRPNGPVGNEPPEANHVIRRDPKTMRYPVEIGYWWPRHIGFDWGYSHESAIMWGAQSPEGGPLSINRRVYVYREMVQSQMGGYRAGYELALASRDELEKLPSHSIILWLSHDAFGQRGGDRSYAELIAMGIASVLGKDAVHLPDMLEKRIKDAYEIHVGNPMALQQRDDAIKALWLQRNSGITIRKADKASTIGWQHFREQLRWESMGTPNAQFNREQYFEILKEDVDRAAEYARTFRDFKPEVLPKLKIFDCCPRLIEALPKLQHKDGEEDVAKEHFKGRDSVDGCLYLLLGMREASPEEPYEAYRDQALTEARLANPGMNVSDLIWVNRRLEAKWDEQHKSIAPFTPVRGQRLQRMIAQGKVKRPNMIDAVYHKL
jgi:hypothetical protein